LSNILTVAAVPITTDGYGLIQRRSLSTSADPGKYSVLAENIHRYWDEAAWDNPSTRIHPLNGSDEAGHGQNDPVDHTYVPVGIPSPLLAMQRGIYEELSRRIWAITTAKASSYKFLAIVFGLHHFRPAICGIVDLGLSLEETMKIVGEERGKDHWEYSSFVPLPLDLTREETKKLLVEKSLWVDVGLAAFVMAAKSRGWGK
jgi:hypothetical protein